MTEMTGTMQVLTENEKVEISKKEGVVMLGMKTTPANCDEEDLWPAKDTTAFITRARDASQSIFKQKIKYKPNNVLRKPKQSSLDKMVERKLASFYSKEEIKDFRQKYKHVWNMSTDVHLDEESFRKLLSLVDDAELTVSMGEATTVRTFELKAMARERAALHKAK
jgi:hypothetical protein